MEDFISDIRDSLKMRIAAVIVLSGLNSYIAIPAWRFLEGFTANNLEEPLYLALPSFAISAIFFAVPFFFTDYRGRPGWFTSNKETSFSLLYSVFGAVILPGMVVTGRWDEAVVFPFMVVSFFIFLGLTAWTLFGNPSNNGKKSTT